MLKRLFLLLPLVAGLANAAPVATPVLEISGKITRFTDPKAKVYRITEAQFLALPQSSVKTKTKWTPVTTFSGVRMHELLRLVGAKGSIVELRARDNYSVKIPIGEFKRYGVVLARSMNGKPLDLDPWGPYFLIYPKDLYPKELNTPETDAKFPWQVVGISVQ
ncbi:MAG: molybdopterin-dependent oxidoreductase [Pseudomonadota bacterium]